MEFIRSPIRYPGAKGRAIPQIAPLIPEDFDEYREPFVGGGSVYLYIRQKYPDKKFWINDLNNQLYNFWLQTKQNPEKLVKQILEWKKQYPDGKQLFYNLRQSLYKFNELELASAYFVHKTIGFSGFTRGYSEANFQKSFTEEKIKELIEISNLLQGTKITNLDFEKLVKAPGEDVFIFCDPPYYNIKWDELYGTRGKNLHANFDHFRFGRIMKECKHRWLITYDDSNTVRKLFDWANVLPWELTYTSRKVKTGKELFISNYLDEVSKQKQANIIDAWS